MECNKDEALKAKVLAEKKMQNSDFEGAQKIAVKAQRLYPDLENMNQLLAVCSVHCSANTNMLGSDKDWYGILQVDRSADELTIKKQYRKLALVLHPDKNKFPGAEAAFKLIGEANVVLSDQTKRSIYDSKLRISIRASQPTSSVHEGSFWTACPYCQMGYQYKREIVNRSVRCQRCAKYFSAYDVGSQPGFGVGRPIQPQQRVVPPNQGTAKMAAKTVVFPSSNKEPQQHPNASRVGQADWTQRGKASQVGQGDSTQRGKTSRVFEDLNTKEKKHGNGVGSVPGGKGFTGTHKVNDGQQECKGFKNKSRKRGRKQVSESSESFDTSSSDESVDFSVGKESNSVDGQGHGVNGDFVRRSSRRRQDISYNEIEDEDYVQNHTKSVSDSKLKEKGAPSEPNLHEENSNAQNSNADAAVSTANGAKRVEVIIDSGSESEADDPNSVPMTFECPDPEFYDFGKDKEKCLAPDQLWACYDTVDGMPRYYAHIKKVQCSPEFSLRFNWLEANPDDQDGKNWKKADLPVACGKFKRGQPEHYNDCAAFSHQVQWEKGKKSSFIIHPRKGEIWALFRGWDISWISEPDEHQSFKFEIVEVLSDFVADVGIRVGYLNKLDGFVSLFQRAGQGETSSFLVKDNELYRFSHSIPYFRLSGTEREGVPEGSFELDPLSVPQNPDELWYPLKDVSSNGKPKTPKKVYDSTGANNDGIEKSKVRKSPRGINGANKK